MLKHLSVADRRRFWRLMALMTALALAGVAGVLAYLHQIGEPLRFHFVVAISVGVGLSMLLAAALMGLVFISNRSGHDQAVAADKSGKDLNA